jgi:cytochrome c oxidase cbb3-type subunit 1
MTVNPRVNPKKLRPYDEPPKRRRTLIPSAPDSAATGFLVAAALWLALATGIGLLALALRAIDFSFSFGLGVFDLSFQLDERRVEAGFVNATVFGWLTNAGFAAIAFMTPRLTGRRMAGEAGLNIALAIWNLSLLGGLAALYVFDLGPNQPLTSIPWLIQGGLAFATLLVTASFLATTLPVLRSSYVSLWFAGIALLSLLGLLGLSATVGLVDWFVHFDALPLALASAFIERAIPTMWLLGIAYATLHYVIPRASGQPLASTGLALLTWLSWLLLAPGSAIAALADPSVPFLITTLGSVATIALIIPAALAVGNLVATMQGRWSLLFSPSAAAVAVVALAFLLATAVLHAIGSLRGVQDLVGGTEWDHGLFTWTMYGAFTLAALALAEHALPRILRRAWGGGLLSHAQLWPIFIGAALAGLALMGGGIAEGSFLAQAAKPEDIDAGLLGYRVVAFLGFGLVALGGLAMVVNMFLLYTTGRPARYLAPSTVVAAPAGH